MNSSGFKRSVIKVGTAALLLASGTSAALAPTAMAQSSPEDRVIELVNQQRANAGCGPVSSDSRLTAAADKHSMDMANRSYFDHTTPEGVTFSQRIEREGYPAPGSENIARGQRSAEEVMDSWMKSPGHRKNILNCSFKTLGVGLEPNGWYWTQDFGR